MQIKRLFWLKDPCLCLSPCAGQFVAIAVRMHGTASRRHITALPKQTRPSLLLRRGEVLRHAMQFRTTDKPYMLSKAERRAAQKNTTEILLILLLRANTKPGKPSNKKPLIFKGPLHFIGLYWIVKWWRRRTRYGLSNLPESLQLQKTQFNSYPKKNPTHFWII